MKIEENKNGFEGNKAMDRLVKIIEIQQETIGIKDAELRKYREQ